MMTLKSEDLPVVSTVRLRGVGWCGIYIYDLKMQIMEYI